MKLHWPSGRELSDPPGVIGQEVPAFQLWHLATIMGTSIVQIEDTYARWLKRTDDQLRAAFDAYDAVANAGLEASNKG